MEQFYNRYEVIDVQDLMNHLMGKGVTSEKLIACAIRNLKSLELLFATENRVALCNNVRTTIAYVKLLYDSAQQSSLARMYLLHRIKIMEVRENDLTSEISLLRGQTSLSGEFQGQEVGTYIKSVASSGPTEQELDNDPEL